MWSYLRLFFSANYWRLVRRRHFWADCYVALRRMHKDRRARRQVQLLTRVLFTAAISLFYLGFLGSALFGGIVMVTTSKDEGDGMAGVTVLVAIAGFGIWRGLNWDNTRTRFLDEDPDWMVSPARRKTVAEWALVCAVMADRAGSERFLAEKTLPEGIEVATRRVHVNVLREHGLWDRLGPVEKERLMRPDGHWEPETARQVQWALEPLRLLRWVLRVDEFLPTVGKTLDNDFTMAKEVVLEPKKLFAGTDVIERKTLQLARRAANEYFQRCAAEGVSRGYFEPESEKNAEWSKEYAAKMVGRQSEDLLLRTKLVSESDEGTIRLATMLALRRVRICDWALGVLSGEGEAGDELRLL
jgi:hypothetical protein